MVITILLFIFLVAPFSLFIHELGHILPGMLLGSDRCIIHIGRGRLIYQGRLGKVHINIGLFFFQGAYSINEREADFSPREKAWISLGGPLLNGGAAVFFFFSPLFQVNQIMLFCFFNLYLAVVNLLPFSFRGKCSDGYRFIQNIKHPRDRVE